MTYIQCKICGGCMGQKLQEGAIPATPSEYCVFPYFYEGQYKGVSTAICYMLVWSKVRIPVRARDFVFSIPVQTNPGTHPASTTMSTGTLYRE